MMYKVDARSTAQINAHPKEETPLFKILVSILNLCNEV